MAQHSHGRAGARWLFGFAVVCAFAGAARAEEPLPPRAVARLGSYQFYHGPDVVAALSPDGSRVASAAWDPSARTPLDERDAYEGVVVLWDGDTGRRVRELRVPHAPAFQPHFSPDGRRLAVGYGREDNESGIAVYDVATGKLQKEIGERTRRPHLVGFAADGKSLLFQDGFWEPLVLWDLASAKPVRRWKRLEGPTEWVKGREYVWETVPSADAGFVASLVDDPPDYSKVPPGVLVPPHVPKPSVVVMTDAATDKPLYRKVFPPGALDRFVFSADGKRFATGGDKITVYETATGKDLFALDAESTYSFALSPDGRLAVAATGASQVQLWNLETRKPSHVLLPGLTYLASRFGSGQVFSADGKTVLLVTGSTLRLFDTATGKERLPLGHRSGVAPRFSADGKTLFTTCDELRQSWDASAPKKPTLLTAEPRKAWEGGWGNQVAAHSPDGRLFVDEVDRRLRIRDTATGRVLHELDKDGWSGSFGVFSPDGGRLALRRYSPRRDEPEVLRLYDTATGKHTGDVALTNGLSWVVPVFAADGKTLGWVDRANDAHVHDGATGKRIRTLHSDKPLPLDECNDGGLIFSPDGGHLIVTTYRHDILKRPDGVAWVTLPTRVFHVASGKEVSRFYTNPDTTNTALKHSCAACSPDGRLLAVAEPGSGAVRLIDVAGGKVRAELAGHRHGVHGLAFSPDGKTLASGGADGVAYLWEVADPGAGREPGK